jgi:hypothetical protein
VGEPGVRDRSTELAAVEAGLEMFEAERAEHDAAADRSGSTSYGRGSEPA